MNLASIEKFRKHAAVISLIKGGDDSTVASVRIGRYLSWRLHIPYYDASHYDVSAFCKLRYALLINGPLLYVFAGKEVKKGNYMPGSFQDALVRMVRTVPNVIWVQNDYTLPPPAAESEAESPFRRAFADRALVPHYWTTCVNNVTATPESSYVNWNMLGWQACNLQKNHNGSILYYGAFREGRREGFDRYFSTPRCSPHMIVSSTSQKFKEYYERGMTLVEPFARKDFYRKLGGFAAGLFMEDKRSRGGHHSPPTRFYEMLGAGLPMLFEPESVSGLERWGFGVKSYVAESPIAAMEMIKGKRRNEMQQAQRRMWGGVNYLHVLDKQIIKAAKGVSS